MTKIITDEDNSSSYEKLLTTEEWTSSHLDKHVGQKHWTFCMSIIWFTPIILTGISIIQGAPLIAIFALIGFIVILVGNVQYMLRLKCPNCPIQEQCHTSF
ncbi:MAG: hypothetical protein GF411_01060 [Candidatus Lokiarchaeota archaeon]|nr:hypothetical protein [Candidatus Lokiarchaeota archaeon]